MMSVVEVYECDECYVRSDQGPDDGLPDGWGENIDGMAFCKECLIRKPLDAQRLPTAMTASRRWQTSEH
jgi:hypothetical protein